MTTFRIPATIALASLVTSFAFAQTSLLEQGRQASARRDLDAAVSLLEQNAAKNPNDPQAHYYLGAAIVWSDSRLRCRACFCHSPLPGVMARQLVRDATLIRHRMGRSLL